MNIWVKRNETPFLFIPVLIALLIILVTVPSISVLADAPPFLQFGKTLSLSMIFASPYLLNQIGYVASFDFRWANIVETRFFLGYFRIPATLLISFLDAYYFGGEIRLAPKFHDYLPAIGLGYYCIDFLDKEGAEFGMNAAFYISITPFRFSLLDYLGLAPAKKENPETLHLVASFLELRYAPIVPWGTSTWLYSGTFLLEVSLVSITLFF